MVFNRLFLTGLLAFSAAVAKPLEVWIMPNGANPQGILEERLAEFKRETGIEAKVVVLDWGEAWSRITEGLETGKGPDVIQLGTTWVSFFASQGLLAPLNAHQKVIGPDRFVPVSWTTTQVDGDTSFYAVPWFMDIRVLMANRAQVERMGLKGNDFKTVDQFRLTLDKLRKSGLVRESGATIYPFAFPGKSDWNIPHNFAPWIWSQGGDFIVKEGGHWQSKLLSENTVSGIRRYIGFVLDSLMNASALKENTAQVTGRFNNGEQVFSINTSEVIMQTRVSETEGGTLNSRIGQEGIMTFPVPAGQAGSVAFIGGSNLALPKGKAKDPQALKLLLFLTRADNLDKYTRKIGFLPPDISVLSVWAQDSLYKVLVDQAGTGRAYPNIPNWGGIESMLVEMFSAIWSLLDVGGLYTDEELYKILSQYHDKINAALSAPATPVMTLAEFQTVIAKIPTLEQLKTPVTPVATQSESADLLANVDYKVAAAVVAGLLLLAIVIGVLRKKKK